MRMSKYYLPTLKETPAEAEAPSHQLMLRAGMIRKVGSGIYSYLPLGWRVIRKVEQIVREEMDRAGAIEVNLPFLHPAELYKETGRWDDFGPVLISFKDRKDREYCIGPTHEEVVTDLVRDEVRSYKDLPFNLYQIQTKVRDEVRPRFGLLRAREFIMKDAYSFDVDEEGLDRSFWAMHRAYSRIFERCGLKFRVVDADSGAIGGSQSMEFMALAEVGEDTILYCPECNYAANIEKAVSRSPYKDTDEELAEIEKIETPAIRTIEELEEFLSVPAEKMIKTMLYRSKDQNLALLLRGSDELNEFKVIACTGDSRVRRLTPEEIEETTGAPIGFAGPVNLKGFKIIADKALKNLQNGITGANEKDYHLINVNLARDCKIDEWADLRISRAGEGCPRCEEKLLATEGIEVGHIFKLGTKYSSAMKATFLDEEGEEKPFIMGCYGIGITRTVAAIIEQNRDENGIKWPLSVAPYQFIILNLGNDREIIEAGERLYQQLIEAGVEVLYDDRDERAGVKFNDADLIGIPFRIVIGKRGIKKGEIEVKNRRTGDEFNLDLESAVAKLLSLVR